MSNKVRLLWKLDFIHINMLHFHIDFIQKCKNILRNPQNIILVTI